MNNGEIGQPLGFFKKAENPMPHKTANG